MDFLFLQRIHRDKSLSRLFSVEIKVDIKMISVLLQEKFECFIVLSRDAILITNTSFLDSEKQESVRSPKLWENIK